MMMDLSVLMPWIIAAMTIANFLTLIRNALSSGEKELLAKVTKAETKLVEYDRRIQAIEGEMKHLPDRDTSHRLELSMAEMNGRFAVLEEKLIPIAATSERLHDLLVEQARK